MRIKFAMAILGLTLCAASAGAQQAERVAEIKRLVPYASMLRDYPSMTLLEYDQAVRGLARQQLREEGFGTRIESPSRTYEPPPVSSHVAPRYTAPQPYVSPYTAPKRYVNPYTPPARTTYDWQSGNTYRSRKEADGDTKVDGFNLNTGSTWQTTIKPNGSMKGYDSNSNPWDYNSRTKTYMNYGTGEICVGEGYARVCS